MTSEQPMPKGDPVSSFVRRLDWRFLLPQPHLGDVAYIGHADGTLWPAVEAFSEAAVRFGEQEELPGGARLLVAQDTATARTKKAIGALSAGGTLYWELPRSRNPLTPWRRMLRASGLIDARVHWHHPNFDACELIVPLNDPTAIASVLRRRYPKARSKMLRLVSRLVSRAPMLWVLLPSVSVTARLPEAL